MANTVEIILKATDQASATLKRSSGELDKLGSSLKSMIGPVALASAGIAAIGKVVTDSVNDVQAYNIQVKRLSENLSLTTEETSRIIQVADDFGVEMSSVTTALQFATKNGFAPTIENLADLADRLKTIPDPTQRAAELTKIFGRNWSELTPLLNAGGDAIRSGAAAIADGMIVTEQAAQASRDYFIAMDNLNDSVTAVKNNIGNGLIPPLTRFTNELNNALVLQELENELGLTTIERLKLEIKYHGNQAGAVEELSAKLREYGREERDVGSAVKSTTQYTYEYSKSLEQVSLDARDEKKRIEELTAAQEKQNDALSVLDASLGGTIKKEMKSFTSQQEDLALQIRITTGKIADLEKKKYRTKAQQKELDELKGQLGELSGQLDQTAADHNEMVNKMIFDGARLKLAEGGYTDAEIAMLQNLASQMGLTSSADETMALLMIEANKQLDQDQSLVMYTKKVNELAGALRSVPTGVNISVWLNIISNISKGNIAPGPGGPGTPPGGGGKRQHGGPVSAGYGYIVGEAGPEYFVPNQSGKIVPNGGGINLTINAYGMDEQALAQAVVMKLNNMARLNRASGRAYAGRA